ncbi:hypothetical protein CO674_25210 [Rhizobium hidalgonense]|uniref:Uncharacterized protein n=1 Tax=Rhizobium hidalgonense TaxID=1538159 RepID=A0ABX4JNJ0_9HYPH|nr:hypothetical protein CO674_25210 [Rhizobium hidalgonense]PON07244.1 hypothetical protein ATY29_12885 [Rhizobium hidalgonense]
MGRSRSLPSIAADLRDLSFADRQTVLLQIVDELQEICEGARSGVLLHPALEFLLRTVGSSIGSIAGADDECWEGIIRELLRLRATMLGLKTGTARALH